MVTGAEKETERARFFPSVRLGHALLMFLGSLFVYSVRVNISVAIICMVRDNSIGVFNNTLDNGTDVSTMSTMEEQESDGCGELPTSESAIISNDRAEFDWDKGTRSKLLAMYFYGYIFTQIPSGWLASRYGGKRVWGVCMFVSALCTLLTPVGARFHVDAASAIRFILGFAAGVTFPCVHAMLGQWCPPLERSILTAFAYSGAPAGNIVTFAISGLLCEYGFDNGWGSIFYLGGIFNMLWVAAWFYYTADNPRKHKNITEKERRYIENAIGKGAGKVRSIPWLAMFKSGPLWAVITAHMCNNWLNYTLLTSLPSFMKESLKFDIKQNGGLSALPYLTQFLGSILAGQIADCLRQKKILSTKMTRKTFQILSFAGIAVCISSVGQMSCEQRHLAVFLLCLCTTFASLNRGGYTVNHIDLAPSYSGMLFGITNTVATVPGMIAPIVAGLLTPNKTAEEWRMVFYICAAVAVFGGVVYAILADGELQDWAVPGELNMELEVAQPVIEPSSGEVKEEVQLNGETDMSVVAKPEELPSKMNSDVLADSRDYSDVTYQLIPPATDEDEKTSKIGLDENADGKDTSEVTPQPTADVTDETADQKAEELVSKLNLDASLDVKETSEDLRQSLPDATDKDKNADQRAEELPSNMNLDVSPGVQENSDAAQQPLLDDTEEYKADQKAEEFPSKINLDASNLKDTSDVGQQPLPDAAETEKSDQKSEELPSKTNLDASADGKDKLDATQQFIPAVTGGDETVSQKAEEIPSKINLDASPDGKEKPDVTQQFIKSTVTDEDQEVDKDKAGTKDIATK